MKKGTNRSNENWSQKAMTRAKNKVMEITKTKKTKMMEKTRTINKTKFVSKVETVTYKGLSMCISINDI